MIRRIALTMVVFLLVASSIPIHSQTGPVLAIEGDHFTVDGTPKFLYFVSYFDALHASPTTWDTDLDYLAGLNVAGVRILPNWFADYCQGTLDTTTGLIQYDGGWNQATLDKLKSFLGKASLKGLLVDVTFTRELVTNAQGSNNPWMTVANYQTAVGNIAGQLTSYRNVLFDVGNEYPKQDNPDGSPNPRLTALEAGAVVTAVHSQDSSRKASASG